MKPRPQARAVQHLLTKVISMGNGVQETWYRGEGAKTPPARAGGYLHDFGDGLYLTDSKDVAEIYARRRAAGVADDERVWMVEVDRKSLGVVLDLSADSRWTQFMNEPIAGPGKSRLFYLKIKQELYDQFFKEFTGKYKIDLEQVNAVIGPEYNLGGRQLCILHKKGFLSPLGQRLRALFRPAASPAVANVSGEVPAVVPTFVSPKIRVWRTVGGYVLATGVMLLLSYLFAKLTQREYEKILEKQLRDLDPDIKAFVERQWRRVLYFADNGQKAYVVVNTNIKYTETSEPTEGGAPILTSSIPLVELVWMDIRDYKIEGAGAEVETRVMSTWFHTTPYTFSSEIPVSNEELASYRSAMEQLDWYEKTVRDPRLYPSDRERLGKEKEKLEKAINSTFGDPVPQNDTSYESFFPPEKGNTGAAQ